MNIAERIVSVVIGVATIIWAFLPRGTFHPGMMGITNREKQLPRWYGRLWFFAVGAWFIYIGLRR